MGTAMLTTIVLLWFAWEQRRQELALEEYKRKVFGPYIAAVNAAIDWQRAEYLRRRSDGGSSMGLGFVLRK